MRSSRPSPSMSPKQWPSSTEAAERSLMPHSLFLYWKLPPPVPPRIHRKCRPFQIRSGTPSLSRSVMIATPHDAYAGFVAPSIPEMAPGFFVNLPLPSLR